MIDIGRDVKLVTRGEWGARPPRSSSPISPTFGTTAHWEGPHMGWPWSHSACASLVRGIQRFHMDTRGWSDIAYCVDADTEILTESGWVSYDRLSPGDVVLTLNHETGMSEWQPVIEVCVFPAQPRELIRMEGAEHSSLTTPNHRWPVERSFRRTGTQRRRNPDGTWAATGRAPLSVSGRERMWATTETLGYWDAIPVAAQCADLPTQAKYSDALVELVAWFWTEGHFQRVRGRPGRNVMICQATERNRENCERIRAALTTVFGPPVTAFPRHGQSTDGVPRWRETVNGHKTEWYLSADAGDVLAGLAPGRVVTPAFILSLTRAQLDLFIDVSMRADGFHHELAQKDRAAAEAFAFAAIVAGHAVSIRPREPTPSTPYEMWIVRLLSKRRISPRPAAAASRGRFRITREAHDGIVWCPRTPNQTWMARRNGTVYFTGNTAVACGHGYVFEGRWLGRRTAANGTTRGNNVAYAVCYLGGQGDPFTDDGRRAMRAALDYLDAHGAGPGRNGHRDWKSTACPGDVIYRWVHSGQPAEEGEMDIADLRRELTQSGTPTRSAIRELARLGARDAVTTAGDPARGEIRELARLGTRDALTTSGDPARTAVLELVRRAIVQDRETREAVIELVRQAIREEADEGQEGDGGA